jgi:hypothetical protein
MADTLKVLHMTSGLLRAVIGLPIGLLALHVGLETLLPSPTAYVKIERSGGKYDRAPPVDPKGEIKFGNVGSRPIHIHRISAKANGKVIPDLKHLFKDEKSFIVTSESDGILKSVDPSKPWESRGKIPYLTVRPICTDDVDWSKRFVEILRANRVQFEVEASSSSKGILHHLTKETKIITIVS